MALFPQLVAGPIIRYKDLCPQLRQRSHSFERGSPGGLPLHAGLLQEGAARRPVAPIADAGFALAAPTLVDAWLGAVAYTFQIYFDFSGYSDMAIGLGLMMGFRFPENFRLPLPVAPASPSSGAAGTSPCPPGCATTSTSPSAATATVPRAPILNLMLVMLLGGLWHGAAWTFVLWGAWHGLFLALERGRRRPRQEAGAVPEARRPLAVAATMLVVIVGWVLFRSATLREALSLYAGMIGLHGLGLSAGLGWQIGGLELAVLALAGLSAYAGPWLARRLAPASGAPGFEGAPAGAASVPAGRLAVVPLFVLALLRTAAESFSPFLYFQF